MFERKFTLRHVIKNFPEMKDEYSLAEEHFGVPWCIHAGHVGNWFSLYLTCKRSQHEARPWSVDVDYELRVVSVTGKQQPSAEGSFEFEKAAGYGRKEFHDWEDVIRNHMIEDTVIVECDVTINKMTGIAQKRRFAEKTKLTDVVLKVGKERFNVSKTLLATFSPYFHKLLFVDSKSFEVVLEDVDPETFHSLLETIHGESKSITYENVESLLGMAEKFEMNSVRDLCEEFLLQCNDDRTKLAISDTFQMPNLLKDCLKNVKTVEDMRDLLPADVQELSQNTLAIILQKIMDPP